nr:MAG: hypothetical protein DIU75_09975 [Mycolicibacterium hassiacum]
MRYQPDGEVDLAPGVSITFSAPMVALDSVDAAGAGEPPVRLDPKPPGKRRGGDPRTLVFVPEGERMPMATTYRVQIPAGTSAANGAALPHDVTFTFGTPPPRLVERHPEESPTHPDRLVLLVFDQSVDEQSVLAATSVTAGRRKIPLRLATD